MLLLAPLVMVPKDIAKRVVARFCSATMTHPTEKALQDYLRQHPGADPKKHERGKPEKKSPWDPVYGKKLRWQDEGSGKMWARFTTGDNRKYSHKYRITRRGTGEWIVELETPDGVKSVEAARSPGMAKQLAQRHYEKLVESEK